MNIGIDYSRLKNMPHKEQVKALAAAADFYLKEPYHALGISKAAATTGGAAEVGAHKAVAMPTFEQVKGFLQRKYATPDDNPQLIEAANRMTEFFHSGMPEIDMAWMQIFALVDMRQSSNKSFDILNANMNLSWEQKADGEIIKVQRAVKEGRTTVNALTFAEGLGLSDDFTRFSEFYQIEEALAEFRTTYFDTMASRHYGLLTALSAAIDIAFDTDDVKTLNKAAASIMRAVRDKGLGAGANPSFWIVCEPEQRGRIEKALTAQRGSAIVNFGTVEEPLTVNIAGVIGTTYIPAGHSGYYLVLPGRKIKHGLWDELSVEDQRNIYAKATDLTGTGRYNGAIADTDQVRRVKYEP